ncbi:MAG: hypothetical protein JXB88_01565 [Spirochaetales bacterium]|nr:hypothetical protein [Spirochaetales bacterium]
MTGKTGSVFFFFFLMVFITHIPLYTDIRYYQSNDIGMKVKEISEEDIDRYEYVLKVEETFEMEKKSLFSEMELIKRWDISLYNNQNIREERAYDKETLESVHYFDRRGRIIEERLYSGDILTQKTVYFYGANQELLQTKTFNSEGLLLYSENYEFNRNGMIRKLNRIWSDGPVQTSSFIYSRGQLIEEIYSSDKEMTISRFDESGKRDFMEVWKEGVLLGTKSFFYNKKDGSLISTHEKDITGGFETDNQYKEERLEKEIVTKGDVTLYVITYFYDKEGRRSKMEKVSDRGLEEWSFYYKSNGDLDKEEYFNRGILEKRTVYTSDSSYYEELFRSGELLIRVFYEDEAKIKEEYLDKGVVIKVKNLEARE